METIKHRLSELFAASAHEHDPGFREIILRLNRKGMFAAGILGIVGALINVGAYASTGWDLIWHYGDPAAIVLWNRLIIMVVSAVYCVLAFTRFGPRWARPLGALAVLLIGLTVLIDDFYQDFYHAEEGFHSDRYLSIAMLIIIAAIPYPPRQAFLYFFSIWGVYLLSFWTFPVLLGLGAMTRSPGFFVYVSIVPIACTFISMLLYHTRYEQYAAFQKAERLTEQLQVQAEQLQEMDRIKARFFANISHEFRTPLTLLLGPIQDALAGAYGSFNPRYTHQLGVMQRNALRLHQLINELLALSKVDAGRMPLYPRTGNLSRFLREIVSSFAALAERNAVTLTFHSEPEALTWVFDADKVEKIITNLLSNALKFTPAQGHVRVNIQARGDDGHKAVEISVRDTGPGIPAEERTHIFDRFYQVGATLTHAHEGSGIGLALVKELVALHEGEIHVESEPGFGTEFIVRLPHLDAGEAPGPAEAEAASSEDAVAATQPPEDVLDEESKAAPPPDAPMILIVDDNADVRHYLRDHLEALYRVVEAADGAEGLALAQEIKPALVISDIMMPKMDGYALCRALKTDPELDHIPVVLLTARATEEDKIEGLTTGADDYIYKPFNAAELVARAENLIELRRHLRERFSQEVQLQPSQVTVPSVEAVFLDQVRSIVEAHLGDSNFGVDWLADEVGLSPRQLQRRLRASTRLSAAAFIRMLRLARAAQLLTQKAGTVSEIAYTVGFSDANYFSRIFRQVYGMPPSEYAAQQG